MSASSRQLFATIATGAALLAATPGARADFGTGVGNLSAPFGGGAQESALWFDRAERLGVDVFRVEITWSSFAPVRPVDPTNPASYDFSVLHPYIQRARARGLDVMFTIWRAPSWAEGPGRPSWATPGSWRPDPVAFGEFAAALTRAFDGFNGPRVRYFEVWNEPNLSLFLTPQWKEGGAIISAFHYRKMLNAFYRAAKLTDPANVVIAAGVAPGGEDIGTGLDPINGRRTRPLQFYRGLMCLKRRRNKPSRCPIKPRFDLAAVHPINRTGPPSEPPRNPDDLGPANLSSLTDALRAAERARRVLPIGIRRNVWATEIWVETNPPDGVNGVPIRVAGRHMAQTLHLLWKAGVRRAINFVIRDQALGGDGVGGEAFFVHGGFWHHPSVHGGEIKRPLFNAFRFPFVAERIRRDRVTFWGRTPVGGQLRIERRTRQSWKLVEAMRVHSRQVFTAKSRLPVGRHNLRARVRGQASGIWALGP